MSDDIKVTYRSADGKRVCSWCHSDWPLGYLSVHYASCPKSATYRRDFVSRRDT